MSLEERIRQAGGGGTKEEEDSTRCLPFSLVQGFLSSSPLLAHMRVSPSEAHHALVTFLSRRPVRTESSSSPSPAVRPRDCSACGKGYLVNDERQGFRVCDTCGTTAGRTPAGTTFLHSQQVCWRGVHAAEEEEEPEGGEGGGGVRRVAAGRFVRGVPAWMLMREKCLTNRALFSSGKVAPRPELEHWNAYAHLSVDELIWAERQLRDWGKEGGDSTEARMAALLLYPRVKSMLPSSEQVRQSTTRKRGAMHSFGQPDRPAPKEVRAEEAPSFACTACGERLGSVKDAKYHCVVFREKAVRRTTR